MVVKDMQNTSRTLKEWAYSYWETLGWSIMPLYHYSKVPVNDWLPLQKNKPTPEQMEEWFSDSLVTGIGVVTGEVSGIVVIDEDSYKQGGMSVALDSPLRSKTGRGGTHHFFKYIDPVKTSGYREGVNVEIKSDGGFIVLPPSKVWKDSTKSEKGEYEWTSTCHISKLPTISEHELQQFKKDDGEPVDLHKVRFVSLGSQHNSFLSLCLAIFNRFKEYEWDIAENYLREEAAKYKPPHPQQLTEQTIRDAKKFVINNPKKTAEEMKPTKMPRTIADLVAQRIEERKFEERAPSTGWPELDTLVKGFIPGHLYTMTGVTNVGKTQLACNFAINLSEQGRKVLYIALEPGTKVIDYLASVKFQKDFKELTGEDYYELAKDQNVNVFIDRDIETIEDLQKTVAALTTSYDLIIIDHIGYFVRDKVNWVQEQGNVIKQLAFLTKENRKAVLMIAHLIKRPPHIGNKEVNPTTEDISGSGAFQQDSTEVMIVNRKAYDEENLVYNPFGKLLVEKTKVGPNGSINLIFQEQGARIFSESTASTNQQAGAMIRAIEQKKIDVALTAPAMWDEEVEEKG